MMVAVNIALCIICGVLAVTAASSGHVGWSFVDAGASALMAFDAADRLLGSAA